MKTGTTDLKVKCSGIMTRFLKILHRPSWWNYFLSLIGDCMMFPSAQ